MIYIDEFDGIYLHKKYIDFRKSINGLSEIVASEMKLDIFSKLLFVFCSKTRDKIKILYWDKTGFALWYKRLEKEKFSWPKKDENETIELDSWQLEMLLSGYNIWKIKPHAILEYKQII